ncbi:hypothetical protein T08_8521 [Trichinella sp. T8]|nr:hypothetical protein T08_8521 [Trichinella sp. T8]
MVEFWYRKVLRHYDEVFVETVNDVQYFIVLSNVGKSILLTSSLQQEAEAIAHDRAARQSVTL